MPYIRCPACDDIPPRDHWQQLGLFRLRCPTCGHDFDISDLPTLLRDPRNP